MKRQDELAAALGPVLERLLSAREQQEFDRILLAAAQERSGCAAAELWVVGRHGWRPLLGLGHHDRLPPGDRVLACLEGRLGDDMLPIGEHVVRSPRATSALALGGAPHAHADDELEALLLLREVFSQDAPDREPPPFPADGSQPRD